MTTAKATCSLNISIEALSALRDDALSPEAAQRLRAHIATCSACQARIAAFNRVNLALHRQHNLDPGQRIWQELQPTLTRKEHSQMRNQRNVISGTAAALSVLVLVVLFAQVLHSHGSGSTPGSAGPTATSATSFTPHPKPSAPPTSTPVSLGNLPLLPPSEAVASFSLGSFIPGGGVQSIAPASITPDGARLLGYRVSADHNNYEVGWLDVATRQFTAFETTPAIDPVSTKTITPPQCCITDGRYYAGSNGVVEGASTNNPFYYDSRTGQFHTIHSVELAEIGIHAGQLYVSDMTNPAYHGQGLQVIDLATGAETAVPGMNNAVNFYSFSWPYVLYTISNDTTHLHVHDIQTNTDVVLSGVSATGDEVLFGDTAFLLRNGSSTSSLVEIDHVMTPGATPQTIATIPGTQDGISAANARLVTVLGQDFSCSGTNPPCNYSLAYDRAHQQVEQLSTSKQSLSFLNDTYLAVVDKQANTVTIFDTATLP